MTYHELVDLLAEHADGLNRSDDLTEVMLVRYAAVMPELAGLLRLAKQLGAALTPVSPSPAFVARLEADLMSDGSVRGRLSSQPRGVWMAALTLAVAGLTMLLRRWLRPGDQPATTAV